MLVALTALGGHETRRLAFDAGFDAHVTKPARIDASIGLVETLRAERGQRQGLARAPVLNRSCPAVRMGVP